MYDRDVRLEPRPPGEDTPATLHIETASRYCVAKITGYDLIDGAHLDLLAATTATGKLYTYDLHEPCIVSTYIDLGSSKIFQQWYSYDGAARVERLDGEALLHALAARFPIGFADIRSLVQRAFETTTPEQSRALWSRCGEAVKMLDEGRPDHTPALHYVRDHLERYMEREPMVELRGTSDQNRWAKKLRLRSIQRLGLLSAQHDTPLFALECLLGKLSARTFHDSQHWIAANTLIQNGTAQETLDWLLREMA